MQVPAASLGSRLKALRRERGLSRESLAEAVGVSVAAVGQWERDLYAPNPANVATLAECLGVPPGDFLSVPSTQPTGLDATRLADVLDLLDSMPRAICARIPARRRATLISSLYACASLPDPRMLRVLVRSLA